MDALVQSATKHIKALGTMQGDFAMTSDTTVNDLVAEAEEEAEEGQIGGHQGEETHSSV